MAVLVSFVAAVRPLSHGLTQPPPGTEKLTALFPHVAFDDEFSEFYGGENVRRVDNGSAVNLVLDKLSGCGIRSKSMFYHGFFSAAVKLPSGFTAGVVLAFYMSNNQVFPKNHDEIDFELLGHEKQKEWVLQTNIYADGVVSTGREEKFYLWFDPAEEFHEYSILWNDHHIIFLVDNIPIREVNHSEAMRAYPSKPMSVHSTIWDGSDWATRGGKKPINYEYAPFMATLRDFELRGCASNGSEPSPSCYGGTGSHEGLLDPVDGREFATLSEEQRSGLAWARNGFMFYSYCDDAKRFTVMPPECSVRG
ncbi:putative xyloglucan endotransglucosylase/hydrolase protein 33 [Platanthera zijinensis]|uniref:Xyloglucan endotransglucosylase/hydrolase n=1 Tax=Platanthera zijinensis TaxID=2320716 RepID=A0AAP0B4H9_9ASPA